MPQMRQLRFRFLPVLLMLLCSSVAYSDEQQGISAESVTKITTVSGYLNTSDPAQSGRVARDGTPTVCAGGACPGVISAGQDRRYDAYRFTNESPNAVCHRVVANSGCGFNAFVVAYLGSFDRSNVCTNYLGDAGASGANMEFSFMVPAFSDYVVVVSEVSPGGCSSYTLDIFADSATGDFNFDRDADIVWRNNVTGENAIWLMDGTTFLSGTLFDPNSDTNWKIQATGDFNLDGEPDLVWRNTATGENAIWIMAGTVRESGTLIDPNGDLNWNIVGAGDFNMDAKQDIVWRNNFTGENAVWLMDGTVATTKMFISPNSDSNWRIVAVADFQGDVDPDLLWRNAATGENAIWRMQGTTFESGTLIDPNADLNWKIRGAADYNGDGKNDILWRNTFTGQNAVWFMNFETRTGSTFINPNADLNWDIVGPK